MRIEAIGDLWSAGFQGPRLSKWVAHVTTTGKSAVAESTKPSGGDPSDDAAARLANRWGQPVGPCSAVTTDDDDGAMR
jgi:hypothetical protein